MVSGFCSASGIPRPPFASPATSLFVSAQSQADPPPLGSAGAFEKGRPVGAARSAAADAAGAPLLLLQVLVEGRLELVRAVQWFGTAPTARGEEPPGAQKWHFSGFRACR